MNLQNVLSPASIRTGIPAKTKEEVISALLDLLVQSGKVRDRSRALADILEREKKLSTGMKNGVGIPHGRSNAVDEFIACVGITEHGVDFDAQDGKPCRIFIMTLSPLNSNLPHLQFLAEVSELLRNRTKRTALLEARTPEEVLRGLTGHAGSDQAS